jgi:hypothetical protein
MSYVSKGVNNEYYFKMLKYLKNYSNLITRVIIIALVIILGIQSISINSYKSSYREEVKSGQIRQTELDSVRKQNEELNNKVSEQEQLISEKDSIISEKEVIISDQEQLISDKDTNNQQLESEVRALEDKVAELEKELADLKVAKASVVDDTYAQSAQIWTFLKSLGFNDYVCAGIMGNIMAEVGGNTLDISRWSQTEVNGYYGICHWAGVRKQRLLNDFGTTLEDQLRFLSVELFEVIPKGSSFYNMQDEKEAALYFAKYYERCGTGSYYVRQTNATAALDYFTN